MKSSMIGNVCVSSKNQFVVYGDVRGLISTHRSFDRASVRALRDVRACLKGGGRSDVGVYEWIGGRWSRIQNTSIMTWAA
jgi:hypothetical protein